MDDCIWFAFLSQHLFKKVVFLLCLGLMDVYYPVASIRLPQVWCVWYSGLFCLLGDFVLLIWGLSGWIRAHYVAQASHTQSQNPCLKHPSGRDIGLCSTLTSHCKNMFSFIHLFLYMCVHARTVGQKTTWRNRFSSPTILVWGIWRRPSNLVINTSTMFFLIYKILCS